MQPALTSQSFKALLEQSSNSVEEVLNNVLKFCESRNFGVSGVDNTNLEIMNVIDH